SEVLVGLTAADRSWVQVQDTEGENLFVGFLAEGETQDYTVDDEVRLWLGDAGAITVSVDGEEVGKAGDIGETKEVSVGPDGFQDLRYTARVGDGPGQGPSPTRLQHGCARTVQGPHTCKHPSERPP